MLLQGRLLHMLLLHQLRMPAAACCLQRLLPLRRRNICLQLLQIT
jgi:hypothetical protein